MDDLCIECSNPVRPGPERAFAEDQSQHPGILGLICRSCYDKTVSKEPAVPWADPISGEVDFEEMGSDLGVEELEEEEFDF